VPDPVCCILVVDDDPLMRQMLTTALAGRGYRVETAGDGRAGLDQVRKSPPDVLLTDYNMPRMTGIELIRTLREERLPVPAVLMSSNTLEELALTARDLEGIQFLRKPFGLRELYGVVLLALRSGSR